MKQSSYKAEQLQIALKVREQLQGYHTSDPTDGDNLLRYVAEEVKRSFPKSHVSIMESSRLLNDTGAEHDVDVRACYHEYGHALTTTYRLLSLCESFENKSPFNRDRQALILAGLFHDAQHSLGRHDDTTNVIRAASLFTNAAFPVGTWPIVEMIDHLSDDVVVRDESSFPKFMNTVRDIILDTEYPYRNTPRTDLGAIMRDADRMSMDSDDWFQQVYEGLYSETYSKTMFSFLQFAEAQLEFMENFHFYSTVGRAYWSPRIMFNMKSRAYEVYRIARHLDLSRGSY